MFAIPTLKEFVDNPMGKGSNAIPSRNLVRSDLTQRLRTLLTDKEKNIKVTVYKTKKQYFFHLTIPSESKERRNTYDVVLEFFTDEGNKSAQGDTNLQRYQVRFFSNSPSFTYTYLYAFDLHGFFIRSLSNKFRDIALDSPPVTRNPAEVISYEKTIFFAALYLLQNTKYLDKTFIDSVSNPYNAKEFNQKIRTTDQIELEINREKQRVRREKEKENRQPVTKERTVARSTAQKQSASPKTQKITKIKARHASKSKIRPKR